MATFKQRFSATIFLVVFSLAFTIMFMNRSGVSTHLENIGFGPDGYGLMWDWGSREYARVVVFGDLWVDDRVEEGLNGRGQGKGGSWPDVFCKQIKCTSYLNFAGSQPSNTFPPAGVLSSNGVLATALANSSSISIDVLETNPFPDLSSQIQSFITETAPPKEPVKTIFAISVGFWDIYNYAGLDPESGKEATYAAVNELFAQLDKLYSYYSQSLSSTGTTVTPPSFSIIILKVLDPSLVPGWLSLRPTPRKPSSIAEHQKNAMYLTTHWNHLVEDRLMAWSKTAPPSNKTQDGGTNEGGSSSNALNVVGKDVFYYDLAQYLLDIIIEYQLQDDGISDATGLGAGDSPFESIDRPCLRETRENDAEDVTEVNGHLMCIYSNEYLFWDAFNLGSVAKTGIGKAVASMVENRSSL